MIVGAAVHMGSDPLPKNPSDLSLVPEGYRAFGSPPIWQTRGLWKHPRGGSRSERENQHTRHKIKIVFDDKRGIIHLNGTPLRTAQIGFDILKALCTAQSIGETGLKLTRLREMVTALASSGLHEAALKQRSQ